MATTAVDPAPDRRADPVERWERQYVGGSVERAALDPWVGGFVHVVRGVPNRPDPVPSGGLDYHQLIAGLAPARVTEGVHGGPAYFDGAWTPGTVVAASRDHSRADTRTSWRALTPEGFGSISVLVPPGAVAAACGGAGLDYDATEFHDLYIGPDPLLDAVVRRLGAEVEAGAPNGRLYAETLLAALAAHLVADHAEGGRRPPTGGLPVAAVRRARDLAHARLSDPDLSVDELAEAAGYSPWHFAREFGRATGESPAAYVARVRMDEAARLLADPARGHWSVAAVALEVGYRSPSAFAKAFRREHGLAPAAYRRDARR